MNRVLRKRLGRELKTNFARYLALVLLIVMGMYIIVSVVASADTIIDGTAEPVSYTHLTLPTILRV